MAAHGWDVVGGQTGQFDLSIELNASGDGPRRIGSIRHGERAVLRSHRPERLLQGADNWLRALVTEPPTMRLASMNLAVLADQRTLAVPRWVTADSALMDRHLEDVHWLDGAWIELRDMGSGLVAVCPDGTLRAIDALVLDNSGQPLDLSTPARRAAAVFGWLTTPEPATTLDTASRLARTVVRWHSVNTESIPAACRSVAASLSR